MTTQIFLLDLRYTGPRLMGPKTVYNFYLRSKWLCLSQPADINFCEFYYLFCIMRKFIN